MKTKKHVITILSLLSQSILQLRTSPIDQLLGKIQGLQAKIDEMHKTNLYNKQLYSDLIAKPQYNIEQKLNSKENRINKDHCVLIHFKLVEKIFPTVSYVESWLVSTETNKKKSKNVKIDFNEQLIYLLEETLRGIKCQFLTQFSNMSQQFKTKYILDYQVQVNPSKKKLKRLCPLHYSSIWGYSSQLDQQCSLVIHSYHNHPSKLHSQILTLRHSSPHYQKKLSQQTKTGYSGQYSLTNSIENIEQRQRKTSLIQFYDEDLNITVLSNDSDSFKKSTGRVVRKDVFQLEQEDEDEEEFQWLVEEDLETEVKPTREYTIAKRFQLIEKDLNTVFQSLHDVYAAS